MATTTRIWSVRRTFICSGALMVALQSAAFAQKEQYFDQLPFPPPIVRTTSANCYFELYSPRGRDYLNPDYAAALRAIAEAFSPVLKMNNFSTPQEFRRAVSLNGNPAVLHDVEWDARPYNAVERGHTIIQLTPPVQATGGSNGMASPDLARLRAVLQRYNFVGTAGTGCSAGPIATKEATLAADQPRVPRSVAAEQDLHNVLYFDFPGQDEKSWKDLYPFLTPYVSEIYAHFFINGVPASNPVDSTRYELVVQYWFFYPFNDGVNNHEGDWEHINVRLTTKDAIDRQAGSRSLLSEAELRAVLTGRIEAAALRISKVDYYFHNFVQIVDYIDAAVYDSAFERDRYQPARREGREFVHQQLTRRHEVGKARYFSEVINQHPVGLIGGNTVGLDVLATVPGGRNRNSHGTYPFRGIFKRIGPLGATEAVHLKTKHLREFYEQVQDSAGAWCAGRRVARDLVCYNASQIRILPDWEVLDFGRDDVAQEWFWLVLPIRWGYPMTSGSPGSGALRHFDLGNAAPVGPSYSSGWNRVGESSGFQLYDPHVIPDFWQTGLQDGFYNKAGFGNLIWLAGIAPPHSVLVMPLMGFFRGNRKFSRLDDLPFRFFSIVPQYGWNTRWHDLKRLHPFASSDSADLARHPTFGGLVPFNTVVGAARAASASIDYHMGRFATSATFSRQHAPLFRQLRPAGREPEAGNIETIRSEINTTDLLGTIRFSPLKGGFQPFLQAGYGWTWTAVSDATSATQMPDLSIARPGYSYKPNGFLPNERHVGVGVDISMVNDGLGLRIGNFEGGLRLGYAYQRHGLHLNKGAVPVALPDAVHRSTVSVGVTFNW